MRMSKRKKIRIQDDDVWCSSCNDKKPKKITRADFLIPARKLPYDLAEDGFNIDLRVVGVCKDCLKDKNNFQKSNVEPVSVNHRYLVRKNIN